MTLVNLILPDCLLIALGWALKNKFRFTPEFFTGVEKLVYFFLFPALIIRSLTITPISFDKASNLLIICVLLAFIGLGLTVLTKHLLKPDEKAMRSSGQCAYRFNTYIGLSLAPAVAAEQSLAIMAILVGFSVPIVNILAVNSMAKQQGNNPLIEIIKNPLVISTAIGLTINFAGITFPIAVNNTLAKLSQSTIPLGLICVGAALMLHTGTQQLRLLISIISIRLWVMPVVGIVLSYIFQLNGMTAQTLVLFTALPAASAAYILAVRMGGDGRIVASIISFGTILAMLSIPMWLFVAQYLFPI